MSTETQILQQISEPNQIAHINSETIELIRPDFDLAVNGGNVVFEIKTDIFKPTIGIKKENMELIMKSKEDSKKYWFECLKKTNGNYDKALELYEKY